MQTEWEMSFTIQSPGLTVIIYDGDGDRVFTRNEHSWWWYTARDCECLIPFYNGITEDTNCYTQLGATSQTTAKGELRINQNKIIIF